MLSILITGFPGLKYGTLSHLQRPSFSTNPQVLTQKRFVEYTLFNKNSCPHSHVITALSENTFFQLIIISSARTDRNWAGNSDELQASTADVHWLFSGEWSPLFSHSLLPTYNNQLPNLKHFHAVNFSWFFSTFLSSKIKFRLLPPVVICPGLQMLLFIICCYHPVIYSHKKRTQYLWHKQVIREASLFTDRKYIRVIAGT